MVPLKHITTIGATANGCLKSTCLMVCPFGVTATDTTPQADWDTES